MPEHLPDRIGSPDHGEGLDGKQSVEVVHTRLREAILRGELSPGSWIPQVHLAELLGVSRTPLREALRLLQREGLIESQPNRRVRVAGFSIPDLEQLYVMRIMLESVAIRLTVPLLTTEDLREIDAELARIERSLEAGDYGAWEGHNREFHRMLIKYAGDRLLQTIEQLSDHAARYRRVYTAGEARAFSVGQREHLAIFEACRAGEPAQAAERLARHYATLALNLIAAWAPEHDPAPVRTALRMVTHIEGSNHEAGGVEYLSETATLPDRCQQFEGKGSPK